MRKSQKKTSPQETGITFEHWITKLYNELGKINVKHDVTKKKKTKKGNTKSQFDIIYGIINKKYVECKYHENKQRVTFNDVSTLAAKLYLNNIAYKQGIVITNSTYETRAEAYADKIGIQLIDRKKLIKLDWKRSHQLQAILKKPKKTFEKNLEERIKKYQK